MPDSFDFILTENYPLKPVSGTSTHVAMRQGFSKQNINDTNQHFFTICGKNLSLVSEYRVHFHHRRIATF
jgi:hypothetical protein